MKQKKLKLSAIILLGLGLTNLQAQNTLLVNEKSGTQTEISLNSIKTLTFPSGNVAINKTDGNTKTYSIAEIENLSFFEVSTSVSEFDNVLKSNVFIYPNPVIDQLQICYELSENENTQIEIVDLQGKTLQKETANSKIGKNYAIISVAQLTKGLYICRLQNGNKIENIKFLKQ
jgi:hypothetical protein